MRLTVSALLAFAGLAVASQAVFSVSDDLLAFPQYEVVFSDVFMSDNEAYDILSHPTLARTEEITSEQEELASKNTGISSQRSRGHSDLPEDFGTTKHSYEWINQDGKRYLCSIPIIESPPRNETSEAKARAEEAQEVARAIDRGWELVQDLDGPCLYFFSGYWSYSFCRNSEVKQFRQLPQQQGRPAIPPLEDPNVSSFILGKAVDEIKSGSKSKHDEWGNEVDVRKSTKSSPPTTELQMEGDTRYLVQKLEGGTLCDLTGKPRRVDVHYHCSRMAPDRISRLKEITTCQYLLTIHTPRLCEDVAFVPPTATKANSITCQQVITQEELANMDLSTLEAAEQPPAEKDTSISKQIIIGGTVVGGQKHVGKEGEKLALPTGLTLLTANPATDIIAKAAGEAEGGQVIVLSDDALLDLELDPAVVQELREKMKKMAGERGWTLEVVEMPGNVKEIHGIVDEDGDDEGGFSAQMNGDDDDDEGTTKKTPVHEEL